MPCKINCFLCLCNHSLLSPFLAISVKPEVKFEFGWLSRGGTFNTKEMFKQRVDLQWFHRLVFEVLGAYCSIIYPMIQCRVVFRCNRVIFFISVDRLAKRMNSRIDLCNSLSRVGFFLANHMISTWFHHIMV